MKIGRPKLNNILKVCLLGALTLVGVQTMSATDIGDINLTGVQVELKTDGTAPFDTAEGTGKDTNSKNQIVRSYDEVTYDVSFAVNGTDGSKRCDIEVIAELPDINTSDKLKLQWLTSNFSSGDATLSNNGTTLKFYIRNLRPGQLFTKSIVLETKAVDNGFIIDPTFKIKVVGSNDVTEVKADKQVTCTAKTNLDVHLKYSSTMTLQEINGVEGRVLPYGVDFKCVGDAISKGKGIGFMDGDIEMLMDLTLTKINIATKEETPADIETSPLGISKVGENDAFGNQIRIGNGIGSEQTTNNATAVKDGGNLTLEQVGVNQYKLTLKNYKITDHFPRLYWGSSQTGNPNARDWNENYKYFASHVFEIFVPRIKDKDASYDVRVNANIKEIKYTTSEGEQTIDCDTTNNTRSLVVPDYISGSYGIHNYTQGKDGETLDRPFWSGGNARILHQGGEGRIQPYVSFNGHTSALEGIKGGLQMVTFIQGDKISLTKEISHYMSNANHNPIKNYQRYYGVGKLTDEQILDPNTDPNILTWYTTLAEAKQHENPDEGVYIYGVATDCTDNIWATGGPQIYHQIYFKVRTENTQPFERIFSKARAYIYRDEARTDMVSLNKSYTPSEYDINGDIMPGTHLPSSNSGGATFQLVPYTSNVSATPKNILTGNGQTSFNIGNGNEVRWEISSSLSGLETNTSDTITIKHIIPNGESYKDGSANIEPASVKTLNDGSTELVWEFNGYSVTQGLPKIIFHSVIPLNTPDRTQFEHITTIDTPGDRRSESEFRTDKDGITVIADASMMINKSVSRDTVEIGENFEYTLSYVNNSEKDYTNGVFLDILPFNGDARGTSYNGSYTIEKFNVPTGVTIEGTNTPANNITDDPLNNGVTDWAPLQNGDKVTAIRFKVANITKRTSNEVKLTLKPTGNLGDDLYLNNFKSSLAELDLPLVSNTVQTKVMSREIRGTVWHDDNDGLITSGERTLEGITVCLLDENGNEIDRTETDRNGNYLFENLLPGTYSVKFITDAGGVKPTIVPNNITDKSNHVNTEDLTSDSFILTSSDTEKVLNLGLVSSLKISKSSDISLVDIGDTVTYSIKVTNTNTLLDATNVQVKDTVNEKLEIVENSISHNGTLDTSTNTINWTLPNLKAGQSITVSFDVVVSKTSVGKIPNVAAVLGNTITDEEVSSNETSIAVIEYSKRSSVSSNDILKPNQTYTYYIDVKNTSNKDVNGIKVIDVLPSGVDIVESSISDNGSYNSLTRKVSWNLSINANTTKTVQFNVRTKTPNNSLENITNVATVNGKDTNEVLNKVGKPLIEIEKSVDKTTALENEEITYTIKVTNKGTVDSGNLTLSDVTPLGSTLINNSIGNGNLTGDTITWDLGTLAPNESKNISFKVTANELADGTTRDLVKNQAIVNEPSLGDISSNKVQTEILKPSLEFNKTIDRTDLLTVGEELIYSINVRNVGTAPQTSYMIRDSIPAYTELVEIFDNGNLEGNTIVWDK